MISFRFFLKPLHQKIEKKRIHNASIIWGKVFKNGPREICGRQLLKNLKLDGLPQAVNITSNIFKVCLPQSFLIPFLNI